MRGRGPGVRDRPTPNPQPPTPNAMNFELKPTSQNPVYLQVREQVEWQIQNKVLAPGDLLPSPVALSKKLSVDKGEIQRAYFELEQSGLVKKTTGKDFLGKPKTSYSVA